MDERDQVWSFEDACRAMDEALLLPHLTRKKTVSELVQRRHQQSQNPYPTTREGRVVGQEKEEDGEREVEKEEGIPEWMERAEKCTWEVLEVLRSASGEWHLEDPTPAAHTNASSSTPHASSTHASSTRVPATGTASDVLSDMSGGGGASRRSACSEAGGEQQTHDNGEYKGHSEYEDGGMERRQRRMRTQGRRISLKRMGTGGAAHHHHHHQQHQHHQHHENGQLHEDGHSIRTLDLDASSLPQLHWNLQEQGKVHRVLYRPGPDGAPFFTMLLEGILHSPVATALAVCWEAPYYTQWWPQFSVPPFKVSESKVVADLTRGHNLAITRLKVPWPFAARELAVSSRVAFVDPISGLMLATISSLPDDKRESSEIAGDGYTKDQIPKVPNGYVRLGVDGGYVLKRLSPATCYMRAYVNMDMKLDVVPVWVINFINRTLAGAGFLVLNQVVNDAVSGKKGIGATFQKLLSEENSLYREVDSILSQSGTPTDAASTDATATAAATEEQEDEDTARNAATTAAANAGASVGAGAGAGADGTPPGSQVNRVTAGIQGNAVKSVGIPGEDLASRDPEMYDALDILNGAIHHFRSDVLSVHSEMPHATSSMNLPAQPAGPTISRNGGELKTTALVETSSLKMGTFSKLKNKWKQLRVGRNKKT